jgi:hypothetical protein
VGWANLQRPVHEAHGPSSYTRCSIGSPRIGIARGRSRAVLLVYNLKLFLLFGLLFSTPFIMPSTNVDMSDSDTTSTLSESLGTKTLEAGFMVPAEYRERPEVESVWVDGRKFLKVNHAANIRMGSPISKIW